MPFSQFIRVAKGKPNATQQKASHLSTDLSYGRGENDSLELVWQNGQIMKQGQSSRARKGPTLNDSPTFISKPQDGKDLNISKMTKFSTMDFVLNDFPLCAPSCEMGLDQDDDIVPWPNFPIVEPFNNEYCSDFLPELGFAQKDHSTWKNLASTEKRSNSNHVTEFGRSYSAANAPSVRQESTSKVLSSVSELTKLRINDTSPLMQSQRMLPRPGNSEITHSDTCNASHLDSRNSVRCSSPMGGSMGTMLHKLDAGPPNNSSGTMNFSYFSRFASASGANMLNTATTTSSTQKVGDKKKGSATNSFSPKEPIPVNYQESGSHIELSVSPSAGGVESVTRKPDSIPPQAICVNDGNNDKSLGQPYGAVLTKVVAGDENTPEPAVATSSVCSGNSLERASNDPACNLKRKCHETGDSEGRSDEAEEESVGVRKTVPGRTSSKRSRAAEVHNLSERRRRDRINEKMRALQELIPNCNKADKASMLDEAIEYLKTLQLQVQILSMGTGMYMPPMILQAAMQQMHRAHVPQFSPMGTGMGMGMGFGMGMHDLNHSMTQIPNIQGPCYPNPGPPNSTSSTFHGAVGCGHQNLGHPDQELLMSMPIVPPPPLGSPPMRLPVGNISAMSSVVDPPHLALSASSKEMVLNIDSQVMLKEQTNNLMNKDSNQAALLLSDQYRAVNADEARNPGDSKPS